MKYSLGQYDYNGEVVSSWMTSLPKDDIESTLIYIERNPSDDISNNIITYNESFKDVALRLITSTFDLDSTYYCSCAIRKIKTINEEPVTTYKIRLASSENNLIKQNEVQQYIQNINIKNNNSQNEWEIIDFIFTPQSEIFNTILFQMSRNANEYAQDTIPQIIFLECSKINNLKRVATSAINTSPPIKNFSYLKIGVQSTPGLRMIINHEEIYVGRTGVYELKNPDIKIESIGMVNQANSWKDIKTDILIDIKKIIETLNNFILSVSESDFNKDKKTSYLIIKNNGEMIINNDINNEYCYYKRTQNNRNFHRFTLDYIYEEPEVKK